MLHIDLTYVISPMLSLAARLSKVCREAVVRVAHERARQLEAGHGLAHMPLTAADSNGRTRKGRRSVDTNSRKVAALVSGSSDDIDGDAAVCAEGEEDIEDVEEEEEVAFGFVDSLSVAGDISITTGEQGPLSSAGIVSSSSHALRPVSAQVRSFVTHCPTLILTVCFST